MHPSKFLDEFFLGLDAYKKHYHTLCRQKQAHLDQERNFRLSQLLLDMDFAENFTIMLAVEIQSAYWITKQVTIFITIAQHLDKVAYTPPSSALKKVKNVLPEDTVDSEEHGGHFWAKVTEDFEGGDGLVKVVDANGVGHSVPRRQIHHRVVKSVAHITVSNDKDHDTWFVQKAMQMQHDWYASAECEARFPGLAAQLSDHLIRSDGAGSHFKNKYTFHYLGAYKSDNSLGHVSWDIGCPGHGKGEVDDTRRCLRCSLRCCLR